MSHQATTWALNAGTEPGERRVGDTAQKFLLVAMADHAQKDGRHSWTSRETLAEYLECSSKTVGRHLAKLLAAGFIRRGDQSVVAHLRRDRRPVVYDLAMSEPTRARWEALAAAGDSSWETEQTHLGRGDNLSPRPGGDDGTPVSPRDQATGGHTGGHTGGQNSPDGGTQPCPTNRGTGEPSPQPPASGGPTAPPTATPADQQPAPRPHAAGCPCRGQRACRSCGTTPRQVAIHDQRAAVDRRRAEEQAATAAAREARNLTLADPAYADVLEAGVAGAREAIASSRRTS